MKMPAQGDPIARHRLFRFATALCVGLWLLLAGAAIAQGRSALVPVPERQGFVTDLTGTLPDAQRAALENKLASFHDQQGPHLAVLLVPTTGPDSIEQYATRVFDRWKPGSAKADDGLLLLVALKDRRMRIEVGQGLEGRVPDIAAGRIIDQQMTPRFRQQDYAGGIDAAVDALILRLDNRTVPGSLPGDAMPLPTDADADADAVVESAPAEEGSRITLFGWTLLAGLIGAVAAACVRWRGARRFTLGLAVVIAVLTLAARYFGTHQLLIGLAVLLGSSFALLLIGVTLYGMRRAWNDSLAGFFFRLAVVTGITGYTAYETNGEPIPVALAAGFSLLFAFMPGTHGGDGDSGGSSSSSSGSSSSSSGSSSSSSSSSGGSSSGGGASGSW